MKINVFCLILLSLFLTDTLSAQQWLWAESAGTNRRRDQASAVATDPDGNTYLATQMGAVFGDTVIIGDTLLFGSNDYVLAKFDSCGQFLWAQRPVSGSLFVRSMKTDRQGNLFVLGGSFGVDFGNGLSFLSSGGLSVLVKYTPSGQAIWGAVIDGSSSAPQVRDVATDSLGNTYVCGSFRSTLILSDTSLNSVGSDDLFVVKYDSLGNMKWAFRGGGSSSDYGWTVEVDSEQSLYLSGQSSSSTLAIDSLAVPSFGAPASMFFGKFDSEGHIQWLKRSESTAGITSGLDLAIDSQDGIYLTGFLAEHLFLDGDSLFFWGFYLAKYDPAGTLQWLRGGESQSLGSPSIAPDINDGVYLLTTISDTINLGTLIVPNEGEQELMLVKFDPSGTPLFAETVGGPGSTSSVSAVGVDISASGVVSIAGSFRENILFGDQLLSSGTSGAVQDRIDVFVAAYGTCRLPDIQLVVSDSVMCSGDSIVMASINTAGCYAYAWLRNDSLLEGENTQLLFIKDSAAYQFTLSESGCSDTSQAIQIAVLSFPETPQIDMLGMDSLSASTSASQYTWLFNGQVLPDTTQTILATQSGSYSVVAENGICFSDTSDTFQFITTDIERDFLSSPYILFPNPNSGVFFLQKTNSSSSRSSRMSILDTKGSLIYEKVIREDSIKVEGLLPGLYLIQVHGEQGIWTRKMLVN